MLGPLKGTLNMQPQSDKAPVGSALSFHGSDLFGVLSFWGVPDSLTRWMASGSLGLLSAVFGWP